MSNAARQSIREMLHDELASIHALNQVLRQPGLHDGARADDAELQSPKCVTC